MIWVPSASSADVEKLPKMGAQTGSWWAVLITGEMPSGLKNLPAKVLFQKVSFFGLLNPTLFAHPVYSLDGVWGILGCFLFSLLPTLPMQTGLLRCREIQSGAISLCAR